MKHLPHYKDQWTPWYPDWHTLTIWDCIADLVEEERNTGRKRPPRAPGVVIDNWRVTAVDTANDAIEKMMKVTK